MSDQQNVFDLTLEEIPVTLNGKEGPRKCKLVELDGEERDQYLNAEKNQLDSRKEIKDFKDIHARLIVRSLRTEDGEKFDIKEIRSFPAKVQKALHKLAIELNGFDEKESEVEAKNG